MGARLLALSRQWPSRRPKFTPRHPLSVKTLGVNLALPTAMAHVAAIELRPNDLASPRTPRRTDDFSPNLERTGCAGAPPSLHTYLKEESYGARNRAVDQQPNRLRLHPAA